MKKIVAEVRFSGQLSIVENLTRIIRLYYPSELPHWQIDSNTNIMRVFNAEKIEQSTDVIQVSNTQFIFSVENPVSDNYFIDKYVKYFKKIEAYLETDKYLRVGVRNIELIDQKNKDETLRRYSDIYQEGFLKTLNSDNPVDYFTIVEYKKERITFGPLAKSESNNAYWSSFNNKDKITDDMFLVDIDCFDTNIHKKNVIKNLCELYERNKLLTSKLLDKFSMDK